MAVCVTSSCGGRRAGSAPHAQGRPQVSIAFVVVLLRAYAEVCQSMGTTQAHTRLSHKAQAHPTVCCNLCFNDTAAGTAKVALVQHLLLLTYVLLLL
jgi:hypothetical protein